MRKDIYFLILIGCFIFGIAVASYFSVNFEIILIILILFVFSFIFLFLFFRERFVNKNLLLIYAGIIFFLIGVWRMNQSFFKIDQELNGKTVEFIGLVDSEAKIKELNSEYKILPLSLDKNKTGKILIKTRQYPIYHYGDMLRISGKIQLPTRFKDFDYQGYLEKEDIYFIVYYPQITQIDSKFSDYLGFFNELKIWIFKKLYQIKSFFIENLRNNLVEPYASFTSGIIVGTGSGFSKELSDIFRRVGISHIVAVSGYNVTIIIIYLFFLLDKFYLRRNQKFYIASLIIFGYAVICGLQASVVRAAIMGFLMLIAKKEKRIYDSFNAVAVAAFFMLIENPRILRFDIGFQLSFFAVLGLLYIYPLFIFNKNKQISFFKSIIFSTIAAQLATFGLLVFNFNGFSIISLLVNILILPVIPLAMFLGFLSGVMGFIPVFGKIFAFPAYLISSYVIKISEFFASLDFSFVEVNNINWIFVFIYYIILIVLIYYWQKKKRQYEQFYQES